MRWIISVISPSRGKLPKNLFAIKEHFEGAKPALSKGDLNIREIRFYFCLHPGSFGEIVSTFTIFDSDLHGGKMVLSLKRPLEFNAFPIAHECEREFLAAFIVEFHLCIKFVVIDGFIKRLAGHCDDKVI